MKRIILACVSSLVVAIVAWVQPAWSDSTDATCKFITADKAKINKASGPCKFSQRQGYVTIELNNGRIVSLSPTDATNHFTDEKGRKVVRTASGEKHEYKWRAGREITVDFASSEPKRGSRWNTGHTREGETPRDLRDLVNGKLVGGEVDDAMVKRGYERIKNSASGPDVLSNWKNTASKDCVTVHFNGGHVRSIVAVPDGDCNKR